MSFVMDFWQFLVRGCSRNSRKTCLNTTNFRNRVRHALTLPLRNRCAELTVLFDRGSTLDLQNFFPLLIDNIFGPQGTCSWGLRCTRGVNEDFHQLEHFLSPQGPLFKLIYNLLKDPSAKYEFPLTYLPIKVQQMLENAQSHPFYADLVHVNAQTKHVISLLLNPFDYYMFHFAYHLINPWHQRGTGSPRPNDHNMWNTVYFVLCVDYITHFLPSDPSCMVSPPIYYSGKNPVQSIPQMRSPVIGSKLINTSVLNKSIEEYTFHQNFGRHPRNQIWRSETVLTVFIDMWLNSDQISQTNHQINSSFNASPVPKLLHFNELPSSEYLRIVRVLMKQIHAFSASAKFDDTHMQELKKIAVPMVEGKFYVFLRNLIHRWPLDGSFRLVLELWLTYIQPWRYPPNTNQKKDQNKQNMDEDLNLNTAGLVDTTHLPFMAENLLCYVVIFQQLLPRFTRVDLVSPKMSIMLYRISKVFSQPNLAQFLKEIENSIENNHSPSHSFNSHWLSSLPPLNHTTNWCSNVSSMNASFPGSPEVSYSLPARKSVTFADSNNPSAFMNSLMGDKKWSAVVRQRMHELEGPTFCYKPLFSQPPAQEVFELLMQIKKSIRVSQELVQIKRAEEQELYGSFWSLFKFWELPKNNDEFSLNERIKVPAYLETSLENLMELFSITQVPDIEPEPTPSSNISGNLNISHDLKFLSPEKVRERMKTIKYDGDPDLHPIRTTEVAFLVRMLYQLALFINDNYSEKFSQLYYESSFVGRLSRQFLSPPMRVFRYDKSIPGSPRVSVDLPPRVTLRFLASFKLLTYVAIGALIAYFYGCSQIFYLLVILSICLLYKCIKALSGPVVHRHNYPTQGFGNISFNDSF